MDFELKYRIGFGFEKTKSVHLCSSRQKMACTRAERTRLSVPSEISDLLLLFFSYFASQNKEIKSGNYFFGVCCAN